MNLIENKRFEEERALYGSHGVHLIGCSFDGEADGESALKESFEIKVENCYFNLRYPFWHDDGLTVLRSEMTVNCRAPLWYSKNVSIEDSVLNGVKAVRECEGVRIYECKVNSPEFGWNTVGIECVRTEAVGEYFMLRAKDIAMKEFLLNGKYSFQYIENAVFENCTLNTKDAFWHARNVTVRNSVVKGEYLGWYGENITFENCKIIGTQPLCYCKGLVLRSCEMIDCDLSFEKSEVVAELTAPIISIKNPASGRITAPSCGEIIMDDLYAKCEIIVKSQN